MGGKMQLTFGSEKIKQHDNAIRNQFLKLGTALLVSLSIASQMGAPKTALAKPPHKTQIVAGKYHCSPPKFRGIPPYGLIPAASDMILSEKNGTLSITDYTGFTTPVKRTANGFTFKINGGQVRVSGTGQFSADGTLRSTITRSSPHFRLTQTHICRLIEPAKPIAPIQQAVAPTDKTMKAVFIRPAKGDFYSNFWTDKNNAARVGCDSENCSLDSVSQDLLASGVTDVFIAFKTDGSAWTTEVLNDDGSVKIPGGHVGDLAYPSKRYPKNLDPSLQYALDSNINFDPIRTLMDSIQSAYTAANKTIHIHAWFPVFADWYAAQIEKQKAIYLQPNPILPLPMPCYSDTGAEPTNAKVVAYELDVISEILTKYPTLYGVNLDYIRYYFPSADCFTNDGKKAISHLYSWVVNPQAIEDFVQQVKAQFPGKVLSADVFVTGDNRKLLGQAGIPKYLDIALPMTYTDGNTINGDSNEVKTWITDFQSAYSGTTIIPILRGFSPVTGNDLISKIIADIQTAVGVVPAGNLDLISDVNAELMAIKSTTVSGYAIFNYVSILTSTGNTQLSTLKNKIGF